MDLGFATHATHPSMRLVFLVASLSDDRTSLTVEGPPNGRVYPPGPGFIYLSVGGVSSRGAMVMVGSGAGPPVAGM